MKTRTAIILVSVAAVVFVASEALVLGFALFGRGGDDLPLPSQTEDISLPTEPDLEVITWVDCLRDQRKLNNYASSPAEYILPEYPDIAFVFDGNLKTADKEGNTEVLPVGKPYSIIFADLTGDGKRDACVTVWERLPAPPEVSAMWFGYKLLVYDPVTGASGVFETDGEVSGDIIFRVDDGVLYAVSYNGCAEPAEFYTSLCFDAETEEIGMEPVEPDYQTKVRLVSAPVATANCVYTYAPQYMGFETYCLLTGEDLKQISQINAGITWEKRDPDYWLTIDTVELKLLCFVCFEGGGTLNVYEGGYVTAAFSDCIYIADEAGQKLYDYIVAINENSLPYN